MRSDDVWCTRRQVLPPSLSAAFCILFKMPIHQKERQNSCLCIIVKRSLETLHRTGSESSGTWSSFTWDASFHGCSRAGSKGNGLLLCVPSVPQHFVVSIGHYRKRVLPAVPLLQLCNTATLFQKAEPERRRFLLVMIDFWMCIIAMLSEESTRRRRRCAQ